MADMRKERTRAAITSALLELSRTQDFESISVKNIAAKAMVNRQTFYRYYCDKYELLEELNDEELTYYSELLEERLTRTGALSFSAGGDLSWFGDLVDGSKCTATPTCS